MKFTIYGSGCAKCKQLTLNAEAAANALGLSFELEKVTDVNGIIDAGVMHTPALAIDDDIVLEGTVSNVDEIKSLLQ
jgi:small redox-active disulfide protein 2